VLYNLILRAVRRSRQLNFVGAPPMPFFAVCLFCGNFRFSITKNGYQKILRIERNFFGNLWKKHFWPPTPRRGRFFGTGGSPPPPTKIDRRAAADTMTPAHGSNYTTGLKRRVCVFVQTLFVVCLSSDLLTNRL